jgi:ketosteroid isomerase-like protein
MRITLLAALTLLATPPLLAVAGPEDELRAMFVKTETAWNEGNLAAHVAPYADSAAMMGRNGPFYGRDRISASLERNFWKDGKPLQQLKFEQVVVRMLTGEKSAVVTGKFILTGGGKPDASGWFTTVWQKEKGGWKIVMDHSA